MNATPGKSKLNTTIYEPRTPISFRTELKNVLNERNLLTAKTRRKVCSMLDSPLSEKKNDETGKRDKFRLQAIEEIFSSEKTYLSQLETLMRFFIIPIKERALISSTSLVAVFGQIEMIYNLNKELLSELENDFENLGEAFLKIAPFFKLYSAYAFDYRNALFVLQDLTNKNQLFRQFLSDTESRPEVQKKLNSLLIVPIQRVPRYKLLLEQVLLYTSPGHPDYKILKDSIREIECTVSHINTVVEDQEITQVLLNVQNSLLNRTPNIVKPSRKVIKEGILNKVTRDGKQIKRFCVLMSDIFMYCKVLKDRSKNTHVENSLECCCIFPLKKCRIYELFPGNFKISCQGDGIILCTPDLHIGQNWMKAIMEAIELHVECRKTLRKESSKRTPMRKKDLKNFEPDSVLSPSKRKCDYDTVFRCKNKEDSGSDNENSPKTLCFKIPSIRSNILKRKHEEIAPMNSSTMSTIKTPIQQKNDSFQFKLPELPFNTLTKLKNLWTSSEKIESLQESRLSKETAMETPVEEFDPTYGFANRLSVTKSYFRTNNIDSTIPTPINHEDNLQILPDGGTPLMDVLYPLRNSGGSCKDGNNWMCGDQKFVEHQQGVYYPGKENRNFQNQFSCENSPVPKYRKKVKFSDKNEFHVPVNVMQTNYRKNMKLENSNKRFWRKTAPYNFPKVTNESLSQRIFNFFSRLF